MVWGAKAVFLAVVFNAAFWFFLNKVQAWRTRHGVFAKPLSGTFEAVAETARQVIAESGTSSLTVKYQHNCWGDRNKESTSTKEEVIGPRVVSHENAANH